MADERKGFLTPEEEEKLHKILKSKGLIGVVDGPVIKLLDNLLLEKIKAQLGENAESILPTIYLVIDEIFNAIPDPV
jgi:hypothetical protein